VQATSRCTRPAFRKAISVLQTSVIDRGSGLPVHPSSSKCSLWLTSRASLVQRDEIGATCYVRARYYLCVSALALAAASESKIIIMLDFLIRCSPGNSPRRPLRARNSTTKHCLPPNEVPAATPRWQAGQVSFECAVFVVMRVSWAGICPDGNKGQG
jgi:hypothetical protein